MLSFLDVLVIKRHNRIITDIFYKLTDTKQYPMFNSCHPKHSKNNIPYNLARRLCTSEILNSRSAELHVQNALLKRRYPVQLIKHRIDKAKSQKTTRPPKHKF
jgi:hypothetical protein